MTHKRTAPKHVTARENRSRLRVLSYNIHQGLTIHKRQIALSMLKEAIKSLDADLVLLQEVAGSTGPGRLGPNIGEGISVFQLEALADQIWPYHAYGRNAVFSGGYHGNAILSRFPILRTHNVDITISPLDKRGMLHAEAKLPDSDVPLHVMAIHLGLLQYERHRQVRKVCHYLQTHVPESAKCLIGGDFNDWREKVSRRLSKRSRMKEAFMQKYSRHARTFPSRFPILRLDRIYFRGVDLDAATRLKGRPWLYLSDHLPLLAEFTF